MDSILSSWNRFTLSDKETSHVHLTRRGDNPEFVLAAKFLTKRALNVEAIGRTFKSLWKSRKEFKIRDVGNHVVLFVFQTDTDAERVLMNEPWSFVKYLRRSERLGTVVSTQFKNDMMGGDFMRITVQVDVSKPLCRGRKVVFDDGKEGWVAFKYEKLPNFCYWCGLVSHDDKDCECWLSSKGTLPIESQEFGT
ncbi:uncharacterized protein LOC111984680 [Quercus suber]|uniref:uncharacterized protein LOC111984680 n=1 Tax=Quercus suber TaxID=58331 RepID=UPI000CE1B1BA|nr:uncharacterized protein LOC111984680 [Quercus suber]